MLFDLGGVLVENTTFQDLMALLPAKQSLSDIQARWLSSRSVRAFETGVIDATDFGICFVEEWALSITPSEFIEHFQHWPKGPFAGAVELMRQLRRRFRTAILSNCNVLHWASMSALTEAVDHAFSSHIVGIAKPSSGIFDHICGSMHCLAEDILFFDDSLTNVEAARQAGLNAVHTDGFAMLQQWLDEHLT